MADITIQVGGEPYLHVEVSFAQTWDDMRAKAGRVLEKPSTVQGVLIVNVTEMPKWSSLKKSPRADDFVDGQNWTDHAQEMQSSSFGSLSTNDHIWAEKIKVEVSFFEKGWVPTDGDPYRVSFDWILQGHLLMHSQFVIPESETSPSIAFPELDEKIINALSTVITCK
jgi:hypothetical protein